MTKPQVVGLVSLFLFTAAVLTAVQHLWGASTLRGQAAIGQTTATGASQAPVASPSPMAGQAPPVAGAPAATSAGGALDADSGLRLTLRDWLALQILLIVTAMAAIVMVVAQLWDFLKALIREQRDPRQAGDEWQGT